MKSLLQPDKSFGSAASSVRQLVSKGVRTIVDNRPSAIAQRKLQGAATSSARIISPAANQAVAQRVITFKGQSYPDSWNGMKDCTPDMKEQAIDFRKAYLKSKHLSEQEEKKFTLKWNSIAKSQNKHYDIADIDALGEAFDKSYATSQKCRTAYDGRQTQAHELVKPLQDSLIKEKGLDLKYHASARNPMLVDKAIQEIEFDNAMPAHQRESRHISTLLLSQHPLGQEVQASIGKEKKHIYLSSNLNTVNAELGNVLKTIEDLKILAAKILKAKDIAAKTTSQINESRNLRHTVKFLDRVDKNVDANAKIHLPRPVATELDGQHAEIRIEKSDDWNVDDYHNPSGTMMPCMGCYLYFNSQKINIGHYHGPMWITNSALSSQLETALLAGKKMGSFTAADVNTVIAFLQQQHKLVEDTAHMAYGKARYSRACNYDYDADSGSDVDDDCLARVREKVKTLA